MHPRKLLFIVASCKVSIGRNKLFRETLSPFMGDRLFSFKLGESVQSDLFDIMFSEVSALGKCGVTTLPPIQCC